MHPLDLRWQKVEVLLTATFSVERATRLTFEASLRCVNLILKDVRDEKEFQVSHLCKAHHVSPSLKDMEHVIKLITETGTSLFIYLFIYLFNNYVYRFSIIDILGWGTKGHQVPYKATTPAQSLSP